MLSAVSASPRLMKFLRFVHDRNPFYLFSALCMFVGFRIVRIARSALESADNLIPDTALEWGFVAIIGSFVLLGIGAAFSLRKRPEPTPDSNMLPVQPLRRLADFPLKRQDRRGCVLVWTGRR